MFLFAGPMTVNEPVPVRLSRFQEYIDGRSAGPLLVDWWTCQEPPNVLRPRLARPSRQTFSRRLSVPHCSSACRVRLGSARDLLGTSSCQDSGAPLDGHQSRPIGHRESWGRRHCPGTHLGLHTRSSTFLGLLICHTRGQQQPVASKWMTTSLQWNKIMPDALQNVLFRSIRFGRAALCFSVDQFLISWWKKHYLFAWDPKSYYDVRAHQALV